MATGHDADSHCSGVRQRGPVPLRRRRRSTTCAEARRTPSPPDAAARLLVRRDRLPSAHQRRRRRRDATTVICPTANPPAFAGLRAHDAALQRDRRGLARQIDVDLSGTADSTALCPRARRHRGVLQPGRRHLRARRRLERRRPGRPVLPVHPDRHRRKAGDLALPAHARGPGARLPGLGERDRDQRRHQLLPDPQLLPGAGRRQRAEGRRARLERPAGARDAVRATARSAAARSSTSRRSGAWSGCRRTSKCVSRRKFRIRIRQPGGIKIQTALVFVNGKKVAAC